MASGRRGGPPDLKSTLSSLLRSTLEQVGAVKDVVEQQARGRGAIFEEVLTQKRRKDALAKLGESVVRLGRQGELGELALDPSIAMALAEIDDLDQQLDEGGSHEGMGHPSDSEAVSSADFKPPSSASTEGEYRVWRPVVPDDDDAADTVETAPPPAAPTSKRKPLHPPRKTAERRGGGGIRFVEEAPRPEDAESEHDLESYMHDDDVKE